MGAAAGDAGIQTAGGGVSGWLVVVVRVPSEPSRHRVAVWRELRRAGAVQLSPGTWALPDLDVHAEALDRVRAIAAAGAGEATVMRAVGSNADDAERLRSAYRSARDDEWADLCAECVKLIEEVGREVDQADFAPVELEEEEQHLDRLQRWYRKLRVRDVFGPSAGSARAEQLLAQCSVALVDFERLVFDASDRLAAADP